MSNDKCPTCGSHAPHLHPANQIEGEVQVCGDKYHKQVTPENTPAKIERNAALRAVS